MTASINFTSPRLRTFAFLDISDCLNVMKYDYREYSISLCMSRANTTKEGIHSIQHLIGKIGDFDESVAFLDRLNISTRYGGDDDGAIL